MERRKEAISNNFLLSPSQSGASSYKGKSRTANKFSSTLNEEQDIFLDLIEDNNLKQNIFGTGKSSNVSGTGSRKSKGATIQRASGGVTDYDTPPSVMMSSKTPQTTKAKLGMLKVKQNEVKLEEKNVLA